MAAETTSREPGSDHEDGQRNHRPRTGLLGTTEKVEDLFNKTHSAFTELENSAAPNGKSITTSAKKLLKYGATENPKRKMRLPKSAGEIEEEEE